MDFLLSANDLDYLLKWIQLLGIPVAVWIYFVNKRKERLDREYGTYDALDDKYVEYLALCLQNPDLDVADTRRDCHALTPDQQHREKIIFTILVSIMERAFLMYKDKSARIKKAQWTGWDAYIREWSSRENFAAVVVEIQQQFDSDFVDYLRPLVEKQDKKGE